MLQPCSYLCGPPLDSLQQVPVLLMLGLPALEVGSHQSGVGGGESPPLTCWSSLDAAQDVAGFLGCECRLLAHMQFYIHQYL